MHELRRNRQIVMGDGRLDGRDLGHWIGIIHGWRAMRRETTPGCHNGQCKDNLHPVDHKSRSGLIGTYRPFRVCSIRFTPGRGPLKLFIIPAHFRPYNPSVLRNPAILDRVIASKQGDFPLDLARQVLRFTFPPKDRARYEKLSYKAQDGSLTEKERAELEDYVNINDLLIVLKAKAQASLRDQSPTA
jgi:hypothetical protein